MYCSTHQMPLFPGTGASGERGEHDNIVNVAARARGRRREFRSAFENTILPNLSKFSPELIIISAGFMRHHRDPLASINLKAEDFGMGDVQAMDLADRTAGGRIVSVLEGGYDLQGLKELVAAHVSALMGLLDCDTGPVPDSAPGKSSMVRRRPGGRQEAEFPTRDPEELESIVKRLEDGKVPLEELS